MRKITLEDFTTLLTRSSIKPRLKSELRFVPSTEGMTDEQWLDSEMVSVSDRSGNKGVLLVHIQGKYTLIPYELKRGIISSATGSSQSVICDLCRTWQYGTRSGSISFTKDKKTTVSYLCCADLRCSSHIRNKTQAGHTSRAQLREDLSIEERVERFRERLTALIETLPYKPLLLTDQ